MPDLGQVPETDMLSYLFDLLDIADDLMYSTNLGPGIALSVPGVILELPAFQTEVDATLKPVELVAGHQTTLRAP